MNKLKPEDTSFKIANSMITFLIPIILANILQSLGQVYGIIIVGQSLGVDALAAISAFFPMLLFLVSSSIGIGSGSSILVGQSYGSGNILKLKEIIGVTLDFTILVSVAVTIFGGVFTNTILE